MLHNLPMVMKYFDCNMKPKFHYADWEEFKKKMGVEYPYEVSHISVGATKRYQILKQNFKNKDFLEWPLFIRFKYQEDANLFKVLIS